MKTEQKGLILTLALGASLPCCVGMGEKPADSAPPVAVAPAAPAATPAALAYAAPDPTGLTLSSSSSQNPPPKPVATEPGATGTTP
jgi:hypothetical protein